MAVFQYEAMDPQGKNKKGVIEAQSVRHARQLIREKKLIALAVTSVSEKKSEALSAKKSSFSFGRGKRMSAQDLSLITRQMATLLHAGIPLDEVLIGVAQQSEKPAVKKILLGVRAKIMEGYSLAVGMGDFPSAFPKLYRTTVESGEKSGKLDEVLTRLAEYTEKQREIRRKIQQALIYPSLMMMVSIATIIFMLIFVVPKIIAVFNQTHQVLPLSTKILLVVSSGLENYGVYLLGAFVIALYAFVRLLRQEGFRMVVHKILLKVPVIGKTIRTINSSRFARTFGILTAASVPVLEAMHAASQMIGSLPMRQAVLKAVDQVREGVHIHTALKNTEYFTPMFVHLVGSGEASGQLESMLDKAALNQESDVNALIEGALTLFEPIMILVMGGVVMFIVMAVMLPIFALDNFGS